MVKRRTIGQSNRRRRELLGLTIEETAEAIGVSVSTIRSWEKDSHYPNILDLYDLAKFFKTTVEAIMEGGVED